RPGLCIRSLRLVIRLWDLGQASCLNQPEHKLVKSALDVDRASRLIIRIGTHAVRAWRIHNDTLVSHCLVRMRTFTLRTMISSDLVESVVARSTVFALFIMDRDRLHRKSHASKQALWKLPLSRKVVSAFGIALLVPCMLLSQQTFINVASGTARN